MKSTVRIIKHIRKGYWIAYSEHVGWTGPAFKSKKAAKDWAVKIGYSVKA